MKAHLSRFAFEYLKGHFGYLVSAESNNEMAQVL